MHTTPQLPIDHHLRSNVFGQSHIIDAVVPYIQIFQSGLSPERRPVANIMLAGLTGTGKTHLVEQLAAGLHGSDKNIMKVNCGELSLEHESARLIGAPPGYLGHKETMPLLAQAKLNAVQSDKCKLSIVLFDEIEKASRSVYRVLLNIMDRGTTQLGDNSTVNFEQSIVFFTTNLGTDLVNSKDNLGFQRTEITQTDADQRIRRAANKHFSPEWVNRLDEILVYRPVTTPVARQIIERELEILKSFLFKRLNKSVSFEPSVTKHLLSIQMSPTEGARAIKREIHKLTHAIGLQVTPNQSHSKIVVNHTYGKYRVTTAGFKIRLAPATPNGPVDPVSGEGK